MQHRKMAFPTTKIRDIYFWPNNFLPFAFPNVEVSLALLPFFARMDSEDDVTTTLSGLNLC
jgi:hypothetical protein